MVASPPIQKEDDIVEEHYGTASESLALGLSFLYLLLCGCTLYGVYYVYKTGRAAAEKAAQPFQQVAAGIQQVRSGATRAVSTVRSYLPGGRT